MGKCLPLGEDLAWEVEGVPKTVMERTNRKGLEDDGLVTTNHDLMTKLCVNMARGIFWDGVQRKMGLA